MNRFRTTVLLAVAALLMAVAPSFAQTALTSTYLSAAALNTDQTITLAAVTSMAASSTTATNYLVIDREVLVIRAINTTTKRVDVTRGVSPGLKATGHAQYAIVYYVPGGTAILSNYDRAGACSTTGSADQSQDGSYTPVFNLTTGKTFSCVSSVWRRGMTVAPYPGGNEASFVNTSGSDQTNATTTFANVTGLAVAVKPYTTYQLLCDIFWSTDTNTGGPKYQWTGPGSPTKVAAGMWSSVTTSTFLTATATAFSAAMANSGTVTTSAILGDRLALSVINGATAGTIQLQMASNGTGTLTIKSGSRCLVQ